MDLSDPACKREYYVALLDKLIHKPPGQLYLGDSRTCETRPGDPALKVDEMARLKILLKGSQHHGFSRMSERHDVVLRPGHAIFWAPHAWTLPHYDRACTFLGLVFRPNFLRALIGSSNGNGRTPAPTTHFFHTLAPITGPAVHVLAALSEQARREPNAGVERPLFHTLLRLCREHIAADSQVEPATQALRSWQRAMEYLYQNYGAPITRDSAARALDLHPNYLSALFQRVGKNSFQDTLETIRLDRARHLLRNSGLKLDRIAHVCGYASTNYFIKVFRQRFGATPGRYRAE